MYPNNKSKLFCAVFALISITLEGSAFAQTYCSYKILSFTKKNEVAYGLVISSENGIPTKALDLVSLNTKFGSFDKEKFYSIEFQQELSKLMCSYKRSPELYVKDVVLLNTQDIAPAIPQPNNIVAVGLNAKAHAKELGRDGDDGFIFSKNVKLSGAYADILRPDFSLLDYEVELGVVVRKAIKKGTRITQENLREYIAGFVLTNDVTNRVPIILDKFDGSFTLAKTYEGFLPVGPYFQPIESVFDPFNMRLIPNLGMTLSVKKLYEDSFVTRQYGYTGEEYFYRNLIEVVQTALENSEQEAIDAEGKNQKLLKHGYFEAGDLILMGTTAGIAMQLNFSKVLKSILARRLNYKNQRITFDYFWPNYSKYYENFGGPYPINQWEWWMGIKTHIVRDEYCNNPNYLRTGDVVMAEIGFNGELGRQLNKIVSSNEEKREPSPGDPVYRELCERIIPEEMESIVGVP